MQAPAPPPGFAGRRATVQSAEQTPDALAQHHHRQASPRRVKVAHLEQLFAEAGERAQRRGGLLQSAFTALGRGLQATCVAIRHQMLQQLKPDAQGLRRFIGPALSSWKRAGQSSLPTPSLAACPIASYHCVQGQVRRVWRQCCRVASIWIGARRPTGMVRWLKHRQEAAALLWEVAGRAKAPLATALQHSRYAGHIHTLWGRTTVLQSAGITAVPAMIPA